MEITIQQVLNNNRQVIAMVFHCLFVYKLPLFMVPVLAFINIIQLNSSKIIDQFLLPSTDLLLDEVLIIKIHFSKCHNQKGPVRPT